MTGNKQHRLTTPCSAAIAGIFFGLLYGTSLTLKRSAIPIRISTDTSWAQAGSWQINLVLGMMPFAGIAYLGFIDVMFSRLGNDEDRFYSQFSFSLLAILISIFIRWKRRWQPEGQSLTQ